MCCPKDMCGCQYFILLINFDLLAFIWSNLSTQYKNVHWANTTKTSPIRIFSVLAQFQSVHFDICKEKFREMLDWLINKGIITWCFSYWPSYRSSVCCIGVRLHLRPIQQASDLIARPIWKTSRNNTILLTLKKIMDTGFLDFF
jgi:hypothetical protein